MEPFNAPLETITNAMGIILTWRQLVTQVHGFVDTSLEF